MPFVVVVTLAAILGLGVPVALTWDVAIANRVAPKKCTVYENGVDRGRDEDGSVMEPGSAGGCPYSCSTESRVIRRLLLPDRTERVFSTDRC